MEDCRVYDINDVFLTLPSTSQPLWSPNSSPSFHGMVKFEDMESGESNEEKPLIFGQGEEMEECFHQPEKKRRLRSDQVQFLEKSFEVENKLDPDRKIQLAKQVGLQPRQVAIWFQNRRARYKTKLLEREYDSLKSAYDKLKADYDALHSDNGKLKHQVDLLREKAMSGEAASPTKSDVLDSDSPSPHCCSTDDSALMEKKSGWIPKVEDECYDDLQPNSGNFGYPVQDQGTWLWD